MDVASFYRMFEKSPGDLTAYGACADLLDEEESPLFAHAFRWMCKRGIYPHMRTNYASTTGASKPGRKVSVLARWAWYRRLKWTGDEFVRDVFPHADRRLHGLPRLLLPFDRKTFSSHLLAVIWLSQRLYDLRASYEVEPPKRAEL